MEKDEAKNKKMENRERKKKLGRKIATVTTGQRRN